MALIDKIFGNFSDKELKKIKPIATSVEALEEKYRGMTDKELQAVTPALKKRLANGETLDDILPDAFAACREASDRVLGMRHFPVQIIGGIVLHNSLIAEMKTGEGKTLVATLPVYLNALTGKGVHVVTVNDYLAKRDSEWMGKLYRFMGLTVGLVIHGEESRTEAYAADITYGTNNEFGFDYLRDNMVIHKKDMVQRGHYYAIVDEVDSILIDEARTPLIISGRGDKSSDLYARANQFVRTLRANRITEINTKEENDDLEGDYIVDEKHRTATLTKEGIQKAERFFNVENLSDSNNMELQHHINQAIKAHGTMKRDVDYVVKDGEIIIVDEFTGRLMMGRRYNEGLHQAIEAKEGVTVARESKTLATITFQNYFRMYEKLAGMTGTALTEVSEFVEIYGLNVVEIPTNKPIVRDDMNDLVYKSEQGKFNAVIDDIVEHNSNGQPILVGTVSIEKSELLSRMLKRRGIKHEVLNAKRHDKEAEIVAQAGKKGSVTIATNMAGRGTDIMLGGNPEYMAKTEMRKKEFSEEEIAEATSHADTTDENILNARLTYNELYEKYKSEIASEAQEVRGAGGLYIIGTERHESRRIDNQLRGRSGRQGDPGATRFFLSLEDDLMRLFGGEKVQGVMETIGLDDSTPIEAKMVTNTVESSQKRIEGRNFATRKSVLNFDDVMNNMRTTIYAQRKEVLEGQDVSEQVHNMVFDSITSNVEMFLSGETVEEWNFAGLRGHYMGWLTTDKDFRYSQDELQSVSKDAIIEELCAHAEKIWTDKEKTNGADIMREVERVILLRAVDSLWMDHIDNMDELRKGIYLRSYGQRDPVIEYRIEGYEMYDAMIEQIKEDAAKMLLTVQVNNGAPQRKQVATVTNASAAGIASAPGTTSSGNALPSSTADGSVKKQPIIKKDKVGRNDPCPCGSGLKYKKCHGKGA